MVTPAELCASEAATMVVTVGALEETPSVFTSATPCVSWLGTVSRATVVWNRGVSDLLGHVPFPSHLTRPGLEMISPPHCPLTQPPQSSQRSNGHGLLPSPPRIMKYARKVLAGLSSRTGLQHSQPAAFSLSPLEPQVWI